MALLRDALLFADETIGGALVAPPPTPFDVLQSVIAARADAEGRSKLVQALRYARENEALLRSASRPRGVAVVGLAAALVGDRQRTLVADFAPRAGRMPRGARRAARAHAPLSPLSRCA